MSSFTVSLLPLQSEIEKTKEIEKEEKAPTKKKLGKMSKGNMRTLHSEVSSMVIIYILNSILK